MSNNGKACNAALEEQKQPEEMVSPQQSRLTNSIDQAELPIKAAATTLNVSPQKTVAKKKTKFKPQIVVKNTPNVSQSEGLIGLNDKPDASQTTETGINIGSLKILTDRTTSTQKDPTISKTEYDKLLQKIQELSMENKRLYNDFYQIKHDKERDIDIAFIYASPQYMGTARQPLLNFQEERKGIKRAIEESGKLVKFKTILGTQDSFRHVVKQKPRILHITCHGEYDPNSTQGTLILETENGEGVTVKQDDLLQNIQLENIMLVFVAACKSDRIGEMLLSLGVEHVICSQKDTTLVDQTTVDFTFELYSQILSGESVCSAFKNAKDVITKDQSLQGDQKAQKFQLKKIKHMASKCSKVWMPQQKEDGYKCMSDHIQFKNVQSKVPNSIEREDDQFMELLKAILSRDNKLTCFHGFAGLGKTYIIRNMMHYITERKFFLGGVIYLNLNDVDSLAGLIQVLFEKSFSFFKLTPEKKRDLKAQLFDENFLLEFLINFFNLKLDGQYDLVKSKKFAKHEQRFLLVLDNCQSLIEKNLENFKKLLQRFDEDCHALNIVVVSRHKLVKMNNIELKSINKTKQVVQFFEEILARNDEDPFISAKEAIDLMNDTKENEYPWNEIDAIWKKEIDDKGIEGFILKARDRQFTLLAKHPLFVKLYGNPTAIVQAANCYLHHIKDQKSGKLVEIYGMLKTRLSMLNKNKKEIDTYLKEKQNQNSFSLEVATRMTLSLLPQDSSIKGLVFFLGCLPGGISIDWLKRIHESFQFVGEGVETMQDEQKLNLDFRILIDLDLVIIDEENQQAASANSVQLSKQKKSSQQQKSSFRNNVSKTMSIIQPTQQLNKRYRLKNIISEFTQLDIKENSKNEIMEVIITFFTEQLENEYHKIYRNQDDTLLNTKNEKDFFNESVIDKDEFVIDEDDELDSNRGLAHTKSVAQRDFQESMFSEYPMMIKEQENLNFCFNHIMKIEKVKLEETKNLDNLKFKRLSKPAAQTNQQQPALEETKNPDDRQNKQIAKPEAQKNQQQPAQILVAQKKKGSLRNLLDQRPSGILKKTVNFGIDPQVEKPKLDDDIQQPENRSTHPLISVSNVSGVSIVEPRSTHPLIQVSNDSGVSLGQQHEKTAPLISVNSLAQVNPVHVEETKIINRKESLLAHTSTRSDGIRTARNTDDILQKPKKKLFAGAKNQLKYKSAIVKKSTGTFGLLSQEKTEVKIKRSRALLERQKTQMVKNKIHRNVSQMSAQDLKNFSKNEMSNFEKFVIYSSSNMVLIQSFQFPYKVMASKFSSPNICFKANKSRIFALCAQGIYFKYPKETEEEKECANQFIFEALATLRQGQASLMSESYYYRSKALLAFSLGFLLQKHSQMLSMPQLQVQFQKFLAKPGNRQKYKDAQFDDQLNGQNTEQDLLDQAKEKFNEAFENFSLINHLIGMYKAKDRYASLTNDLDDRTQAQDLAKRYEEYATNDFVEHNIEDKNKHIHRNFGCDISLMTEVVLEQSDSPIHDEEDVMMGKQ